MSSRKREWQYILDYSKIVIKLCKSSLGNIENFSDIFQDNLLVNMITNILIFNMPETNPLKFISS